MSRTAASASSARLMIRRGWKVWFTEALMISSEATVTM